MYDDDLGVLLKIHFLGVSPASCYKSCSVKQLPQIRSPVHLQKEVHDIPDTLQLQRFVEHGFCLTGTSYHLEYISRGNTIGTKNSFN